MNLEILKNVLNFMERVPMTGREAIAWTEAVGAIQGEINKLEAPPKAPADAGQT